MAWSGKAAGGPSSSSYPIWPDIYVYNSGGNYYAKNMFNGSLIIGPTTAQAALQAAVDNTTYGHQIVLSSDFDGDGATVTITRSNLSISTLLSMGMESGSEWWRVPRISKIALDATANTVGNIAIRGLNLRELDMLAQTNIIVNVNVDQCGFRPSSTLGFEGIRFRGNRYITYVHVRDCHCDDLYDHSATANGFIDFGCTTEGTGQIWIENMQYKARSNGARFMSVSGRVDQLVDIPGLSFVCYGMTGVNLFHLAADKKASNLFFHDGVFECHDPITLFQIDAGGGTGVMSHGIDFSHNHLSCGDDAGDDLTFINNDAVVGDYISWAMSRFTGAHNRVVAVNGVGNFVEGTTGACARMVFDLGYTYWDVLAETNVVATKG